MRGISAYRCVCDPCGRTITNLYNNVGARLALARYFSTTLALFLFLGNRKGCPYKVYLHIIRATARVAHTDVVKRNDIFPL
ncbi:MAG: hypothetical protein FWH18_12880 [Marinilabiliaceae bacterium]|nr:hypothetical protein [Marinilabiliaceae bacterium]